MADRWAATSSNAMIFRKFDHSNFVPKRHITAKFGAISLKLRTTSRQNMRNLSIYIFFMVLITINWLSIVSKYDNPLE